MHPHDNQTERPAAAPLSPGVPEGLAVARVLARLLDDAIPIPGTAWRIGIDPLLGLVPGIGDILGALLSTWLLVVAARLGAPLVVLARMGGNVAVDTVVGAVPIFGDAFDAAWKSNRRNLRLLEEWIEHPGRTRQKSTATLAFLLLAAVAALATAALAAWQLVAWASRQAGA